MQLRRPEHPGRVAIVAVGGLLAVNLGIFALRSTDTTSGRDDRPPTIERVFPVENAVARPQEVVGVDLDDSLQGILYIDGLRIPEDQYEGDPSLGQVIFRPGQDREFESLPGGPHVVTVEYWSRTKAEDEARAAREIVSYSWSITIG